MWNARRAALDGLLGPDAALVITSRLRLFGLLALLVPLFAGLQYLVREAVPRVEIRLVAQDAPAAPPVLVPVEVPVERVVERIVYVPVERSEAVAIGDAGAVVPPAVLQATASEAAPENDNGAIAAMAGDEADGEPGAAVAEGASVDAGAPRSVQVAAATVPYRPPAAPLQRYAAPAPAAASEPDDDDGTGDGEPSGETMAMDVEVAAADDGGDGAELVVTVVEEMPADESAPGVTVQTIRVARVRPTEPPADAAPAESEEAHQPDEPGDEMAAAGPPDREGDDAGDGPSLAEADAEPAEALAEVEVAPEVAHGDGGGEAERAEVAEADEHLSVSGFAVTPDEQKAGQ